MILFENVHLNKERGILEADVVYTEEGTDIKGRVGYRISDEVLLGLENIESFHRIQMLKGMICLHSDYRRGRVKEGGKREIAWG